MSQHNLILTDGEVQHLFDLLAEVKIEEFHLENWVKNKRVKDLVSIITKVGDLLDKVDDNE